MLLRLASNLLSGRPHDGSERTGLEPHVDKVRAGLQQLDVELVRLLSEWNPSGAGLSCDRVSCTPTILEVSLGTTTSYDCYGRTPRDVTARVRWRRGHL